MIKKKILFIVNVDKFFLSHRIDIAYKLIKRNYEVHLACKFTENTKKIKKKGLILHNLNLSRSGMGIYENLKSFFQIFNIIKKIKPDLVHAITIKPIIFTGIASYFTKISSIVFSITGLGFVFLTNGIISQFRKSLIIKLFKICFKHQNCNIIFQNPDDLNFIIKKTKLSIKKTSIIYGSGVFLKKYIHKEKYKNFTNILFASRLLVHKGIREFVKASQILKKKNINFIIAGNIDKGNPSSIDKKTLQTWISKNYIKYIGFKKDIKKTIFNSDIVVLPSYGEGFPKILIEAAAAGKPVITTDVSGCRNAIIPGKTGILIKKENYKELVNALDFLIKNKKIRKKMGIEAKKFARNTFDINNVILKHEEIYKNLILK